MTPQISFGRWLRQRRKTMDITCEDLAGRIGCAASTIYKIEVDARRPSRQIVELLAQHLNILPDEHGEFVRFARAEAVDTIAHRDRRFQPPTNLPTSPTLLIGRDEDVSAIGKRLYRPESRLLTLLGPPGIGKTRLALEVAARSLGEFIDGVFFVAFAPISDPNLVLTTIATILGIPEMGLQTPLGRLRAVLHNKQMLLLLDNFEQILPAAPDIAELLSACPSLKLLVTSRAPLRIRHERQISVSSLAVPDLTTRLDLETIAQSTAITLFMERAQVVKPEFVLTETNAPTVAAICARLDGLPLAIELISARVKLLPPAALLERLHGRLMLQSDGLRDLEPRHRTLNAAIDWSHQLLNGEEQILFRRLGAFVGGWTLDAARVVCSENLNLNILDGLASLLDKNLVKQAVGPNDEPRFTMLETIREYAVGQMVASGELKSLQQQHANYFVTLVETPDPALTGAKESLWWDRLEVEHANLRTALAWSRTEASGETGLRLAVALVVFWRARGHFGEARGWLTEVPMFHEQGVFPTEAVRFLQATALLWLATFSAFQGDIAAAEAPFQASLALFRELGDSAGIADALGKYGMMTEMRGDYERANALMQEGLTLSREVGNPSLISWGLFFLSTLAYIQGKGPQAQALGEESLRIMRSAGDISGIAADLICLAAVALDQEDYRRAGTLLRESLIQMRDVDERWQAVHTLEVCARLVAVQAKHTDDAQALLMRSARIFGATEALRETFGSRADPFERRSNDQGLAALRSQLDKAMLALAWSEGRKMTLDQVIAYTLEDTSTSLE